MANELTMTDIADIDSYLYDMQVVINIMSISAVDVKIRLKDHIKGLFQNGGSNRPHSYLSDSMCLSHVKHIWMLLKYAQADRLLLNQNQVTVMYIFTIAFMVPFLNQLLYDARKFGL